MTNTPRRARDLRLLLAASAACVIGLAVVAFAFGVPLYRHIVHGTAPATASSFLGFWGLFITFGSAASIVAYFQSKAPPDGGPRGGHRLAQVVSLEASRRGSLDGAAEHDRPAA